MNASKKSLNSIQIFDFNLPEQTRQIGNEGLQIYQWIGLKDCASSLTAYRRKDYKESLKFLAIAIFKFSTITAAVYGIYKLTHRDTIYLNDLLKQAETDFSKNGGKTFVPSSVQRMVDTAFHEYKKFSKWPTSKKSFFEAHLKSNAPMSGAITEYLLTEGVKQKDNSFEKFALKSCLSASVSSLSCMAVIDFFTKSSKSQSLDTAMKIYRKCRKNNAFCSKTLEQAEILSIKSKSLDEVTALAKKISRDKKTQAKEAVFLEEAIKLFNDQFLGFIENMTNCQKAKEGSGLLDTAQCFLKADGFEKTKIFLEEDRFFESQEERAIEKMKKALTTYGVDLAKACAKFPNSKSCTQFVDSILQKLIENDLFDEAFQLLISKKALQKTDVSKIIETLSEKRQLNRIEKFIRLVQANHPKLNIQSEIDSFQAKVQEAKSALLLMRSKTLSEKEVSEAVKNAFLLNDEKHLINIFTIALTWIDNRKIHYPEALKLIVRNLFALDRCIDTQIWCNDKMRIQSDMAKILVTKYLKALGENLHDNNANYELYKILDYDSCKYSSKVTKNNWEALISYASY